MKTYMVTFLLLLFEVNLNFGHKLSKIELKNEEIYELVNEDQSALLITQPKEEVTKLREIIYYHIIERPYDAKELIHDKIAPHFEKRVFTNSHSGIPFEKKDDDEDESSEEINDSSNSSQETDDDGNSSESIEEKDNEQSPGSTNDLSIDKINDENDSSSNRYNNNDLIMNDKSDVDPPIDADSIQIDIRFNDFVVNTTKGDAKVESATTNVTAEPETKTEGISETPQSRSKREINHTLTGKAKSEKTGEERNHADGKTPKRDRGTYGMSLTGNRGVVWNNVKPTHIEYHVGEQEALTSRPDVVAEDITTTESAKEPAVLYEIDEDNQGVGDDGDADEEEEFKETFAEIEKIVNELIDNMDKTNKSESKQENKTDGGSENSGGENKHVADNEHDNEDSNLDPIEVEKSFIVDNMDKTNKSESKQENKTDGGSENSGGENKHVADNEHDNEDSNLDPIEVEKSFIEIFKVFKELTGDDTSNPSGTDVNDATKSADDAGNYEEKVSGESSSGTLLRTTNEDEEIANDLPIKIGSTLVPKRNEKDKETSNKENDSKQQQFVKELLKNKYFWAWLKDASGAYLEILMKKLNAVIKTEIGKQIEQYFKEHKIENCKQDKIDQNTDIQEPNQTSNVTDEMVKGNPSDTPSSTENNSLASNDATAESINQSNETNSEISTKKHNDKPSDDKNTETPVKIEAQNLFGSSVGSGKVTNFFFYNINKAFYLENIRPIKNVTNGVFGLEDTKPEQEKDVASDKDTTPEVETVKPDISSEHNKTIDKVVVTDQNHTSTEKPETEKDYQSFEKDKIEDIDQVKDEDNVEQSKDKSEVIPNDPSSTEANNDDKTSTEMNKESAPITERPVEAIKDDKKDAPTEKVETKKDLNDSESDKSK